MSDNRITYMHSGQTGAVKFHTATNGQLLTGLDSVLVSGFNEQTATLVVASPSSVTLTYASSHGYANKQLVEVSGATDLNLNGRHRITSMTTTTITIDAANVNSIAGTIQTKVAPLGFESIFGNTDPLKRAYRSQSSLSTKTVLYLDMSYPAGAGYHATTPAMRAMVTMCEDMQTLGVPINDYTSSVNNKLINVNGSLFWYQIRGPSKATAISKMSRDPSWVVVGNDEFFYVFYSWFDSTNANSEMLRDLWFFGEMPSLAGPTDRSSCGWAGSISENDTQSNVYWSNNGGSVGGNPASDPLGYFIGSHDNQAPAVPFTSDLSFTNSYLSSGHTGLIPYPNLAILGFVATSMMARTTAGWRARMPSIMYIPQKLNNGSQASSSPPEHDLKIDDDGVLLVTVANERKSLTIYFGYYAMDLGD